MALANLAALRSLIERPTGGGVYVRTIGGGPPLAETGLNTLFHGTPFSLATPTASVALDSTSLGATRGAPTPSGNSCLVAATATLDGTNTILLRSSVALVIDRLNEMAGIDTSITTLQTTNLPTTALTRYTSGVGVYAALLTYGSLGAADSVVTVTYTNSAGTGSRTATVTFSSTPPNRMFYPIPLQAGDLGVRSVESVQLSVATGGTGFGISLYKPLAFIPIDVMGRRFDATQLPGWNSTIESGACLEVLQCESQNKVHVVLEWGLV